MLLAPWRTLPELLDGLRALDASLHARADRRGVFASAYAGITAELVAAVRASAFEDPAWIERYAVRFADYYRAALEGRGEVPAAWRQALAVCPSRGPVMDHVMLSMNAHINHDLALALADVLDAGDLDRRLRDFLRVLDALGRAVPRVQATLWERWAPGLRLVAATWGPVDEALTYLGIRHFRRRRWDDAVRIVARPAERDAVRLRLDRHACRVGAVICPWSASRRVQRVWRAVEDAGRVRLFFERVLPVPPDGAFPWLVVPERMNAWSLATVRAVAGSGVGARREVRVPTGALPLVLDEVVEACEPPNRFVYRVVRGHATGFHRGELTLAPHADGALLRWRVEIEAGALGPAARRLLLPKIEASLDALVRVVAPVSPLPADDARVAEAEARDLPGLLAVARPGPLAAAAAAGVFAHPSFVLRVAAAGGRREDALRAVHRRHYGGLCALERFRADDLRAAGVEGLGRVAAGRRRAAFERAVAG